MISRWSLLGLAVVSLALLMPAMPNVAGPTGPTHRTVVGPPPGMFWGPASTPIQHVVTIVMENRAYDNYFGTYCQSLGPYCSSTGNGLAQGMCLPLDPLNPAGGCQPPFNFTAKQFQVNDMPHDYRSGASAWNRGYMNNFFRAEGSTTTFGHYNATTIPIYWDMAEEYASGDNFFAANLSYSLPNHWYLLAGQAPNISEFSYLKNTSDRNAYLAQADATPSVVDLLNQSSVSWRYYDYALASRSVAITGASWGSAYDYWNPLAAKAESYSGWLTTHFADRSQFLTDISSGTLPQASWLIPAANESDHPGYNLSYGESFVAQSVDAIEASPYWNSTAIFVIWDDYGGWYDHVAPPRLFSGLLSFRSPLLVISPYAKENYIGHQFTSFFSILRYTEWQFGIGCLTRLDCTATPMFDYFDFNQTARAPILFPVLWNQTVYPMPLQTNPTTVVGCPTCGSGPSGYVKFGPTTAMNLSLGD